MDEVLGHLMFAFVRTCTCTIVIYVVLYIEIWVFPKIGVPLLYPN